MAFDFIFGGNTGVKASDLNVLRERQKNLSSVQNRLGVPQNFGQGLTSLGYALMHRLNEGRVAEAERLTTEQNAENLKGFYQGVHDAFPDESNLDAVYPLTGIPVPEQFHDVQQDHLLHLLQRQPPGPMDTVEGRTAYMQQNPHLFDRFTNAQADSFILGDDYAPELTTGQINQEAIAGLGGSTAEQMGAFNTNPDISRQYFGLLDAINQEMPEATPEEAQALALALMKARGGGGSVNVDVNTGVGDLTADVVRDQNITEGLNSVVNSASKVLGMIEGDTWGELLGAGLIGKTINAVPGTPAYEVAKELEVIQSNVAFGRLAQMRAASKTGGALGQISNKELTLLSSTLTSIDQGLPASALRENLMTVMDVFQRRKETFDRVRNVMNEHGGALPIVDEITGEQYNIQDRLDIMGAHRWRKWPSGVTTEQARNMSPENAAALATTQASDAGEIPPGAFGSITTDGSAQGDTNILFGGQ